MFPPELLLGFSFTRTLQPLELIYLVCFTSFFFFFPYQAPLFDRQISTQTKCHVKYFKPNYGQMGRNLVGERRQKDLSYRVAYIASLQRCFQQHTAISFNVLSSAAAFVK